MGMISPTTNPAWTINDLLRWTTKYLTENGVHDSRLAAEVLLARAAECQRIDLYTRFDQILPSDQVGRFRDWVRRAASHEPIAYIVGEKEFYSLAFAVTCHVLIPRPESETLVETVLAHCKSAGKANPRILEIGTGSGCLAIAVLANAHCARCVATDISAAALALAAVNAERHGVVDRMELIEADGLDLPAEVLPKDGFDLLMSNPPYVPESEVDELDQCVKNYEPHLALSDHQDGLRFYRSFGQEGAGLLAPGGRVMVEIGAGMAPSVIAVMTQTGQLRHERTLKDTVVGLERVLVFGVLDR
jgi:release factor glutamine methyltransferase